MISDAQTRQSKANANLDGITFRHLRDAQDYPAMLETYRASMDADALEEAAYTLEELTSEYEHLVRCDPAKDILLAGLNGKNIAFGRCWWDQELNGDYRYSIEFHVKPEWWGTGLGRKLVRLLLERLEETASQHPADAHKFYKAFCFDAQNWKRALLESFGFTVVRYGFSMVRPCSEHVEISPLPDDIEVRPVTSAHTRQVWEAAMEAFRDHNGFAEPTEENYQRFAEWQYNVPELWKVAWDGDEIAGMVLNFINEEENSKYNRKRGYTEDISVRRPWRRQGIARALLTRSIQMFQEMGMEETSLDVDTQNPNGALSLYHSVGYKEYRKGLFYHKEMSGLNGKEMK